LKKEKAAKPPREAAFHPDFRKDFRHWVETERQCAIRAFDLIEAIMREPFTGIGKPEPLSTSPPAHGRAG